MKTTRDLSVLIDGAGPFKIPAGTPVEFDSTGRAFVILPGEIGTVDITLKGRNEWT